MYRTPYHMTTLSNAWQTPLNRPLCELRINRVHALVAAGSSGRGRERWQQPASTPLNMLLEMLTALMRGLHD